MAKWTQEEKELLAKHTNSEVARITGRSYSSVKSYRSLYDHPPVRSNSYGAAEWSKNEHLLGAMSDVQLSKMLGVSVSSVAHARQRRGIKPYKPRG